MNTPIIVMILDGFGESNASNGNAIKNARTPNLDLYRKQHAFALLKASGTAVGLPQGQMGNSEVGHLTIGSGRVILQSYMQINQAIENGSFFKNESIIQAFKHADKKKTKVHLIGLCSDGGVHSHLNHLKALVEMSHKYTNTTIVIHAILDGRDVSPKSAISYIQQIEAMLVSNKIQLGSVAGRFYTMDRDKRWARIKMAYDAYTLGIGHHTNSGIEAIQLGYERNETDEFIQPTLIISKSECKPLIIEDGDSIINFNFRPDRARQITQSLTDAQFNSFERIRFPKAHYVCLTQYNQKFPLPIAFAPEMPNNTLAQVLSKHGKRQLHIAETEKYAHVTFFLNGQKETPFPLEDRVLIPSAKVETYNLKPEMSIFEIEKILLKKIKMNSYDIIFSNIANPDMVGHTGNYLATVQAIEVVDQVIGNIVNTIMNKNGIVLITADHGNAECMLDKHNSPVTAHTCNNVPLWIISNTDICIRPNGILSDVAVTVLELMQLPIPKEMTGQSLIL